MLSQQVLTIVVPVWRSNHAVDMLLSRLLRVACKSAEIRGKLVIKLNHNHWALHAVVERAVSLCPTDPGKPGVIEMAIHFVHLHARMPLVHVAHVQFDQVAEALPRWRCKIVCPQARVFNLYVIPEMLR